MATTTEESNELRSPFYIHDQYVKDLTFENPNFLMKYSQEPSQPQVTVNVEASVASLDNGNYEVTLDIAVKSTVEDTQLFVLELKYAGLIAVAPEIQQDILETVLLVHCPFLMFPYAREIVSSVTSSGGYPPLMIEPIDFASLYISKKQQGEKQVNAAG
ncbi:MAG: protein-export chaperone SecB [Holosporales bacterium]|jgi:preprotein translocase subunit SecB|nr:protein-export chaperone SecB [Holosporales bacterium]